MTHGLLVFLALLPFFLLLDYLWLGRLMQGFYLRELGDLARREGDAIKPRLPAAAGVYLALPGGIVLFALPRVDPARPVASALCWGLLYGLVVYSVYDLTNRATLREWPIKMATVDICWGGILCAVSTLIAALLDPLLP
ncbi:DUF2177 family protein [Geobacter sulfurreducens subsp. ethanolicus]|uniref:DUF2177 family protein n=1 Tax=Geobacter sulfurreducens TaxID=35554 RepID=UPI002574434F|nr:DUF2177 family protein [Geobacter sulfurreducens]BEH09695.1 DUF2177 family protein [Geobacter sulfurreducens subsp. ethanolicus]